MAPVVRAVRAAASPGLPGGLLVARVRYRHRGWNGSRAGPAHDARRALDELAASRPGLPTVLIGHSMGGRAALRVAGHPLVRAVIGLAPWCPPGEPVAQPAGRRVVLLHDPADTVTDAEETWRLVRRARAEGVACRGVAVPHRRHTMLRGAGTWHRLTAAAVCGVLRSEAIPPMPAGAPPDTPSEPVPAVISARTALSTWPLTL
ncbi:alpha/beta hydrolase [Streptomyces sp. JW3]|uniref:alpha/beta hydrolase n=1 Tax=Streptomyces sp. JW3 TaxID=3456955 RepID=UPI003FA4BB36